MKNIIKTLLVVMTLVLALVAFTGCELPGAECTHEGYETIRQSVIPTCTETGLSLGVYCSNCDAVIKEQEVTEARGHDKKTMLDTTATCTEAGVETWYCAFCGENYELAAEAYGHELAEVAEKAPTCTEEGHNAHKACKYCDYTEGKETVAATGHTLADVEAKGATCTEDGYNAHKACECGYTEGKEVFEATGHDYDHVVTAPTCTEAGYTTHTCAFCDYSYTDAETEATGHTLNDVAAKEATCAVAGYTAHKACACGYTEGKEAVEATGAHADTNGDYKCDVCATKMLPADGTALTIPQALAIANIGGTAYTTQKYYVTGVITNVYNTTYGNMYIQDADGNELCIYGLYDATGKTRYDAMSYKPVVGDEVTVYTVLGMYNSTCQGKNAWLDEVVAHEHDYKAVVTDPTCTKGGYTTHSCTICGNYYTDSETEATGHTTENGVCDNCGQTIGGDVVAKETFTADFGTLTANSSYTSAKTTSGWQGTNTAVVQGGASDSNPTFKVIGSSSASKGYVLNGKTSAKGKVVSPTLTGGLSKITFNYTNPFSESNGVDITITVKQNGTAVATKKLDNNSVTKLTAYTFTWDLEAEGVAVTGDYTIEITNNSPTNSTSNKDRVAIWNFEWTNNPTA